MRIESSTSRKRFWSSSLFLSSSGSGPAGSLVRVVIAVGLCAAAVLPLTPARAQDGAAAPRPVIDIRDTGKDAGAVEEGGVHRPVSGGEHPGEPGGSGRVRGRAVPPAVSLDRRWPQGQGRRGCPVW